MKFLFFAKYQTNKVKINPNPKSPTKQKGIIPTNNYERPLLIIIAQKDFHPLFTVQRAKALLLYVNVKSPNHIQMSSHMNYEKRKTSSRRTFCVYANYPVEHYTYLKYFFGSVDKIKCRKFDSGKLIG